MKWPEIILVQKVAGWLDVRIETLFCNTHGDREAVGPLVKSGQGM